MSFYVSALKAGSNNFQTTPEHVNQIGTDFVQAGVVGTIGNSSGAAPMTGNFQLNQFDGTSMRTQLTPGVAYVSVTPSGQNAQVVRFRSDANYTITHANNTSGGTVYDFVYLNVDPALATTPDVNGTTVGTIIVSRSTVAGPDNGTVGNANPYKLLIGWVAVANNATAITNANITDKRVQAGLTPAITAITINSGNTNGFPMQIRTGSWVGSTNSTGDGTITWSPAFPNGTIGMPIIVNGYGNGGLQWIGSYDSGFTKSSANFRCNMANSTIRVNYIVYGY